MSKEKATANMLTFACPDTLRSEIDDYRYTMRISSQSEAIRRLVSESTSRFKTEEEARVTRAA